MKCPFCNQDNTRVVDSRPVEDTNSIRRRRLCDACGRDLPHMKRWKVFRLL